MKLVPDAKDAWRWFSVQALALITALPVVWMGLPDDLKAVVPESWYPAIIIAMGAAGIVGRLIDQGGDT